ncbi:MAG: D-hexose-6-phosphate mutarotase [Nitrosomonadales bacterium]|nr:D-hexose-6-phosphate mutarotase [Nitrosomonadales bacterium]
MDSTEKLNRQFGIGGQLGFRAVDGGLVVAEINNAHATASLCLQGAHLMAWQPRSQAVPVIWLSRDAVLASGKAIRGGTPVCWPWFGAHVSDPSFPAHGFARTAPWRVIESGSEPDGATRLTLCPEESDKTRALWPHDSRLELTVIAGETLRMELVTENTGITDFEITEALHTYFRIGDIGAARVGGLAGCDYRDKVGGSTPGKQDGTIRFTGETDRVYVNTAAECAVEDDMLKRRIRIAKSGSLSTVVWTPWTEKANRMGDMGQPDGWRETVCVETANALENAVKVAAGARHTLIVEYRAEPM